MSILRCGSPGTTTTISSPGQAILLSPCSTYTGSIAVATSFPGQLGIFGVKTITESLIASNAPTLTSLISKDLETIGTAFIANSLTAIANISLPALKSVPVLRLENVGPVLSGVDLSAYDGPGNVTISQTWIEMLNASSFAPTILDSLTIFQNRELETIDLSSLSSATNITIAQNSANPAINLTKLKSSTSGIYLNQLSALDLNSLKNVSNGGLTISTSTLETIDLPLLSSTSNLSIVQNSALTTINLPLLREISGSNQRSQSSSNQTQSQSAVLTIANNTLLTGDISLPNLTTISGSISINGTFSNLSLPQLSSFTLPILLQSTQNISTTCDNLAFSTFPTDTNTSSSPSNITCIYPNHSPSPHSTAYQLTTAIIAAVSSAGIMLLISLIACIFLCFQRRQKRRRVKELEMRRWKSRSWRTLEEERRMMKAWPMYKGDNGSSVGGF